MSYRGQCPNCGKILVLGQGEVGRTAVCGACGTRFAVRLHEPPAAAHGRGASPDAGQALHAAASDLPPWPMPSPALGLLAAMGERPGEMDVQISAPAAVENADPELTAAAAERPGRGPAQARR